MIAKLQNPVVVSVLALISGMLTGLGWYWKAASVIIAATPRPAAQEAAVAPEKEQGWDFWTVEIDNLAAELKGEKARLKQQAEQIELRSTRLAAEQQELAKVRAEIEAMRREIEDRTVQVGTDEAKNLRTLATTYSNLSPRAAVAIIKEMDDVTVVKIFSLMKPDVVAPIFEEMSHTAAADGAPLARRAAVLSEKIRLMRSMKTASNP